MHRIRCIATSIILCSLLSACSNEVPLAAEKWEDNAYVYGLLNSAQDTQFIRIGKAFLGEGPAQQYAKIPDSLYYKNIIVRLHEVDEYDEIQNTFAFHRIDKPGLLKDGIFTGEGYHLYYSTEKIYPTKIYKLEIEKPDGGPTVYGTTTIAHWNTPTSTGWIFYPLNDEVEFFEERIGSINVTGVCQQAVNTLAYEFVFHVYIKEQKINDKNNILYKKLQYHAGVYKKPEQLHFKGIFPGRRLMDLLRDNLPHEPTVLRYFSHMHVEAYAGGHELFYWTEFNKPTHWIHQEKPTYTNIVNGIGVFGSRCNTFAQRNNQLRNFTIGEFTSWKLLLDLCDLNFVVTTENDSCYCENGSIKTLSGLPGNCGFN